MTRPWSDPASNPLDDIHAFRARATERPGRVAVEIVEKQWGRGILVTRVPAWDPDRPVGHNQEEVPREVFDQPEGTIVYATLTRYGSTDLDGHAYTMPVFSDWEWPGGAERPDLDQVINNAATARTELRVALASVAGELPNLRAPERGRLMRRLRQVDFTLQEIADLFGVTREAVRQTVFRSAGGRKGKQ